MNFKIAVGILTFGLGAALAVVPAVDALADEDHGHAAEAPATMMGSADHHAPITGMMRMPEMNAGRGMILFAEKGCVMCHSVNGVGGEDAAALDAHGMEKMMNPFDFAAKMWRMAPAMIAAQEEELGHQILFTGDELADIIAFVHEDAQQHKFTVATLPPEIREMLHGHDEGSEEKPGHVGEIKQIH